MKKSIISLSIIFALAMTAKQTLAQHGPPQPPGGHGSQQNQSPGGGAPIGSGLGILLTLGLAYGGRKTYKVWKEKKEQN